MKKIQYNSSSKLLNNIIAKINLIIDKLVVDVKVNGTSVVVVNEEGEREADIDLSLADQNVKQSPTTSSDNSDYRVLLSKSANDTEETDISRKDTNLKYNPSTGNLQTTKLNGNTVPSGSGNDTLAKTSDIPDMTNYIQKSLTVGLVKNDGTIDQTQYATMSDIPDELADLADDSTHRLVTDTDKTTWNNNRAVSEIRLTNEDLNNVTTVGFYYAAGGNTVTNKPSGYNNFGLVVIHNASGSQYTQIISNENGSHRRIKKSNGTWTSWTLDNFTDEKVKQTHASFNDDIDYRILLSYSGDNSEETNIVKKYGALYYNPYEATLYTTSLDVGSINVNDITVSFLQTTVYHFQNSNQNIVASLEANSSSTSTNPTELYLPASSGTLALKSESVLWSHNNLLGAKNLLQTPYYDAQKTLNGITWTINEDGSITATGTRATSDSTFYMHTREFEERYDFILPNGTYILSDGGVGNANAEMQMGITKNGAWYTLARTKDGEQSFVANGDDFSNDSISPAVLCIIKSGQTNVDITFKPMIRLASIVDSTFEPYAQTNRQLTINKMDWNDYAEYGVKNLIPYPWEHKNGRVNRGITFGCSGEGYVTFNGTASTTQEPFFSYTGTSSTSVANGTYLKISGNKRYRIAIERTDDRLWAIAYVRNLDGTDTSNLNIFVEFEDGSTAIKGSNINTRDSGISHKSLYFIIPNNNEYYIQVDIRCSANTGSYSSSTAKGRVILQPYEISDLSWMPYAKSNYELTTLKAEYKQISTVELTDSASRAYAKNELMIWRGDLHRVTQAITSGGSITLNTNVVATTLSAEIKAIRDALNI